MVRTHLQNDARGEPLMKRIRRETRDLKQRLKNLLIDFREGRKTLEQLLHGVGHNIRLY